MQAQLLNKSQSKNDLNNTECTSKDVNVNQSLDVTSMEGIASPIGNQANNSDLNNCVSLEDLSVL